MACSQRSTSAVCISRPVVVHHLTALHAYGRNNSVPDYDNQDQSTHYGCNRNAAITRFETQAFSAPFLNVHRHLRARVRTISACKSGEDQKVELLLADRNI